jgi:Ras-related C3 botulinum toxin substrate 1
MDALKLVVVGDGGVGKTTLVYSYLHQQIPPEVVPTIVDTYSALVNNKGHQYNLHVWDTAGQEDFDHIRALSYISTDIYLVCFSVVSRNSFENAKTKWIEELKHHSPKVPIILVGTKTDLRNNTKILKRLADMRTSPVSFQQGVAAANQIGATKYLEASPFTDFDTVKCIFDEAIFVAAKKKRRARKKHAKCVLL